MVGEQGPRPQVAEICCTHSEGDTIVRILHYPPLPPATPPGAVRAAAHEDINLITLLAAATASGLGLMAHDGRWVPIDTTGDVIIVDAGAGDMLCCRT